MKGFFKTDLLVSKKGSYKMFDSKADAELYLLQEGVPYEDIETLEYVEKVGA